MSDRLAPSWILGAVARSKVVVILLPVVGVLISLACIKVLPYPYIWVSLAWVFILFSLARSRINRPARLVCVYVGATVLAFGIAEGYFWSTGRRTRLEITSLDQERYVLPHDVLGFAPAPRNRTRAVRRAGSTVVYDVQYTIDSTGLRVAPAADRNSHEALLFFGCSFTYGEGVHDTETAAYQTGLKTNRRFRVYNFGFSGYGPHQILARLQQGSLDSIVGSAPKYAVYQAITGQIPRVLGLNYWNRHDPRYAYGEDGHLKLSGHFDDGPTWWSGLQLQLDKCLVFRKLRPLCVGRQDVNLFIDIIDSCRTTFERKYPGSEFHVIFWAERSDQIGWDIIRELRERGVRVHTGDMVLDGARERYMLSRLDGHPNAVAHEAIAEFVVTHIVR